jgi:hypothetical protein
VCFDPAARLLKDDMKTKWQCKKPAPCGMRLSEVADCSEPCEAYKNWRYDMVQAWIIRIVVALVFIGAVLYSVFAICNNHL